MSTEAHTPGPWVIERGTYTLWVGPSKTGRVKVGDIVATFDFGPQYSTAFYARQDANARLIAAAPDLLEALQNALLELEHIDAPAATAQARAAIAKAVSQ